MARTPESKVKDEVKRQLEKAGAYYFMPVQTGMGAPTLDFLVCYKGVFFAIETKAEIGMKMTERQTQTAKAVIAADGRAFLVDGIGAARSIISTMELFL